MNSETRRQWLRVIYSRFGGSKCKRDPSRNFWAQAKGEVRVRRSKPPGASPMIATTAGLRAPVPSRSPPSVARAHQIGRSRGVRARTCETATPRGVSGPRSPAYRSRSGAPPAPDSQPERGEHSASLATRPAQRDHSLLSLSSGTGTENLVGLGADLILGEVTPFYSRLAAPVSTIG